MINGASIKRIRKWLGHSQPKLAQAFGVSIATIWRWEHDRVTPGGPAMKLLEKLQSDMEATDA